MSCNISGRHRANPRACVREDFVSIQSGLGISGPPPTLFPLSIRSFARRRRWWRRRGCDVAGAMVVIVIARRRRTIRHPRPPCPMVLILIRKAQRLISGDGIGIADSVVEQIDDLASTDLGLLDIVDELFPAGRRIGSGFGWLWPGASNESAELVQFLSNVFDVFTLASWGAGHGGVLSVWAGGWGRFSLIRATAGRRNRRRGCRRSCRCSSTRPARSG